MVGGLLCLTPLSTIFQLYRVGQFYWSNFLCNIILVKLERKKGDRDIMLYRVHLTMSGIRTQNVSGDRHRLHRKLKFQLTYDHDVQYDGNLMWDTRHMFIIFCPMIDFPFHLSTGYIILLYRHVKFPHIPPSARWSFAYRNESILLHSEVQSLKNGVLAYCADGESNSQLALMTERKWMPR